MSRPEEMKILVIVVEGYENGLQPFLEMSRPHSLNFISSKMVDLYGTP
jgi:hypothetical protein